MKDLIRASVLEVVRSDEVNKLIDAGVFDSMNDYYGMLVDAANFLGLVCNPRCLARVGHNEFRCRKPNNRILTTDNTNHVYKNLPNDCSYNCVKRLIKIGFAVPICMTVDEEDQHPVAYTLPFFNPKRHIPPHQSY